jgi:hypothetical protein
MNDDSSLDGGRFDTGAMGDLDPMVNQYFFSKICIFIQSILV